MQVAIGIDLGGTNVKGILLNEAGEVLHRHSMSTNDSTDGSWRENVFEMVRHLKSVHPQQIDVIGISCPGLANPTNTSIAFLPNRLTGLQGLEWDKHLNTKTFVINDAHAALIAESKYGVVKGYDNAVLLTLGTGVGGGILINGELYQGQSQMAGHFGHTCINPHDDELSILGMPGSLEYAIGNYSIERRSAGRFKSTAELVKAYSEKDHFATWLWLDVIRKLSLTLSSLANSLSPQIIVLAGGITLAGELLLEPLQQFMSVYEYRPNNEATLVKLAKFSELSGAIGAAAFAFIKTENSRS